jgi:hypothetical protein
LLIVGREGATGDPVMDMRERVTALPEQFRDSPEVVEELSEGGVDFVAGPTDLKLEGQILSTGQAAWVTYYWNAERTVEFDRRPAKTSFEVDEPQP